MHLNYNEMCQYKPSQLQTDAFEQFLTELVSQALDDSRNPHFYIPQQKQQIKIQNNIISNSWIIYGVSGSGKTSSALWATAEQPDVVNIIINCDIDVTEQQISQSIFEGIKYHLDLGKKNNKENVLVFQNIKFDGMNEAIKKSGKKFVFIIKKCQLIAQMKKPILIYNLLQWINGPMKPYLGLVFLSRAFHFTSKLQKRVKSRLTAKTITLVRPQGQKIIKIFSRRFQSLRKKYVTKMQGQKKTKGKKCDQLKLKLQFIQKLIKSVQKNQKFTEFATERLNGINNQFITCMKTALLKSLEVHHLAVIPQNLFNIELIRMLNDAIQHITPGYTKHLVKECPLYCVLALAIIAYIGAHERTPYTLGTVYQVYIQKVANNSKFLGLTSTGSSKKLFQNALQKLLDLRLILFVDQQKDRKRFLRQCKMDTEIMIAMPPTDIAQIIQQKDDIPAIIKELLKS